MLTVYGFPEEVAADIAAQWAQERSTMIRTTGNAEVRTVGERRPDVLDEISPVDYVEALTGVHVPAHGTSGARFPITRTGAELQGLQGAGARVVLLRLRTRRNDLRLRRRTLGHVHARGRVPRSSPRARPSAVEGCRMSLTVDQRAHLEATAFPRPIWRRRNGLWRDTAKTSATPPESAGWCGMAADSFTTTQANCNAAPS